MPTSSEGWLLASSLFATGAYWFVRDLQHHKKEGKGPFGKTYRRLPRHDYSHNTPQQPVSPRGQQALAPPIPYLKQFLACLNVSYVGVV